MSCSQSQELSEIEQPIRSQVSKLTQLLTMTTTQKFPSLDPQESVQVVDAQTPSLLAEALLSRKKMVTLLVVWKKMVNG